MTRKERAMDYFYEGYNCAQSLVLAFEDLLPLSREPLMKLASSFGGGIGRLREVCGAVSGTAMVLGFLYGYSGPEGGQEKDDHYQRVQELAGQFEEQYGTILCRELLGLGIRHDDPHAAQRTKQYYEARPCAELVGTAAGYLEAYIAEHPL